MKLRNILHSDIITAAQWTPLQDAAVTSTSFGRHVISSF
jgi:hypothetical protein